MLTRSPRRYDTESVFETKWLPAKLSRVGLELAQGDTKYRSHPLHPQRLMLTLENLEKSLALMHDCKTFLGAPRTTSQGIPDFWKCSEAKWGCAKNDVPLTRLRRAGSVNLKV